MIEKLHIRLRKNHYHSRNGKPVYYASVWNHNAPVPYHVTGAIGAGYTLAHAMDNLCSMYDKHSWSKLNY